MDAENRRHGDAQNNLRKSERPVREVTCRQDEHRRNHGRMQGLLGQDVYHTTDKAWPMVGHPTTLKKLDKAETDLKIGLFKIKVVRQIFNISIVFVKSSTQL